MPKRVNPQRKASSRPIASGAKSVESAYRQLSHRQIVLQAIQPPVGYSVVEAVSWQWRELCAIRSPNHSILAAQCGGRVLRQALRPSSQTSSQNGPTWLRGRATSHQVSTEGENALAGVVGRWANRGSTAIWRYKGNCESALTLKSPFANGVRRN